MSPDDPTIIPAIRVKHKRTALSAQYLLSKRTSNLSAPKESLADHKDDVITCDIDPTGELVLSGGSDCLVRICPVYTEDGYVMVMSGHSDPIMQVGFSFVGKNFYTCSADNTVANWDTGRCIRINTFHGHQGCVNSVKATRKSPILCSGSSDGTIRIWDLRARQNTITLNSGYRVFATIFPENENHIISAGDNNDIHIWDMRKNEIVDDLIGHTAGVTGLDVSPCGNYLLSHSRDNTLCTWNLNLTQSENGGLIKIFPSNQGEERAHLLRCSWSKCGQMVAAGNANSEAHIWNADSCQLLYTLLGHKQSVNDIVFHPYEPIVLTASDDKHMIFQELTD